MWRRGEVHAWIGARYWEGGREKTVIGSLFVRFLLVAKRSGNLSIIITQLTSTTNTIDYIVH